MTTFTDNNEDLPRISSKRRAPGDEGKKGSKKARQGGGGGGGAGENNTRQAYYGKVNYDLAKEVSAPPSPCTGTGQADLTLGAIIHAGPEEH